MASTRKNRRGFTLIEMLVVVLIIADIDWTIIARSTVGPESARASNASTTNRNWARHCYVTI